MLSKNLKYYRLKNNLSKKELASKVNVSPMAITHYENGDRRPDMEMIKKLAQVLHVKISDFLAIRNNDLHFVHEQFRKNSSFTKRQQEFIKESVEEYFGRFFEVVEILGGEVLPESLPLHSLPLTKNREQDALMLRNFLSLNRVGPVGNLIEILENSGILVYLLDFEKSTFSGMNGTVNGRPYIILNKNMTVERIRTTIVHELVHLFYQWPEDMDDKECENYATQIAGAFMISKEDMIRELGVQRKSITKDMCLVCQEYGIALSLLVVRAEQSGIITDSIARKFFILNNKNGKDFCDSKLPLERPILFEQLVYRAVNEEEISIQKGAELLKTTYDHVALNCQKVDNCQ
ncbi:XRE family transcriptional regulator [Dubosiella newyorkensis]|jgi:Zn-dependent peptidase ImmA (M78 family)/DNA-binding XRE family transcriptional regulator|uniref:HTH cro/C1-type domain-containing protein n=1 Tax=Dubosiella newyorkensis TaxID=1862672 RepID=A0A1U7NKP3_9FIRM|nr:XRE family transcriptional regulator [Dubosiella newyorkensis]MCI9042278.1 ImmA/IrrE family metallo-endopeptidase [Dubosiella newyorkensis]OLU44930.1 hypothetical protein BO225_09630 [Dubosiella newyorkensis]